MDSSTRTARQREQDLSGQLTTLRSERDSAQRERDTVRAQLQDAERDRQRLLLDRDTLQQRLDAVTAQPTQRTTTQQPSADSSRLQRLESDLEEERKQSSLLQAMAGVVTFNDITPLQALGVGGFGIVFKCTVNNPTIARLAPTVAVKVMHNFGVVSTTRITKDYTAEYAVLATLRHPNIIRMYRCEEWVYFQTSNTNFIHTE
jgi:multidrug efflux pump subunit AcrA (membrane-fusion protein)